MPKIKNYKWLITHIDIWYKILTDSNPSMTNTDSRKVETVTNLIRLVKQELEKDIKK